MNKNSKVLVAYYADSQLAACKSWPSEMFEPWDVRFNMNSLLLEFDLLTRMRAEGQMNRYEYSGLISHSALEKLAMNPIDVQAEIQDGIDQSVDVILLNPSITSCAFFKNGIEQGQLFHDRMGYIFDRLGYGAVVETALPYYTCIMCSYVIGKASFWDLYFDEMQSHLSQVENLIKTDPEFARIYLGKANYLLKENLSYAPFVVERMMQIVLCKHSLKIKYLEPTREVFVRKYGPRARAIEQMYALRKQVHTSEKAHAMWESLRSPFMRENGRLYRAVSVGDLRRTTQSLSSRQQPQRPRAAMQLEAVPPAL